MHTILRRFLAYLEGIRRALFSFVITIEGRSYGVISFQVTFKYLMFGQRSLDAKESQGLKTFYLISFLLVFQFPYFVCEFILLFFCLVLRRDYRQKKPGSTMIKKNI